tara:strand:- start:770 stop:1201 length:432 start_codon:yes stop_codon:yes gene_type:complete
MTTLEASGQLYTWFSENDSFSLEKDFMKVIPITEEPERDRAAFLCALKDFEEGDMIKEAEIGDEKYWILKRSFLTYPQNITVTPETALLMSTVINKFCEIIQNDKDKCDPANVSEEDIKNLLYICNYLTNDPEKGVDLEQELL